MSQKKGGVALSYISLFLKIAIAFFYTPFLIRSVGDSEYGIFNIVGSLLAYVAIVDFGINDTTLRYVIQIKNKNTDDEKGMLGSISFMYTMIGLILVLASLVLYYLIPTFFASSFTMVEVILTQRVFVWSMIGLFFTLFFNPLGAIILAYEKFVLLKVLEIVSYIIIVLVSIFLISSGYGIYEVVVATSSITIASVGLKYWYAFGMLKFPMYLKYFNQKYWLKMIGYAAPIFIVVIVEQIYWKLDNLLIGSIIGASAVAIYALGFFFQKYILSFAQSFSRVFIPSFISEIENGADRHEITSSLIKIARLQILVVLPIISGLSFFGKEFIQLWLGDSYAKSYYVLLFAMVPFSIEIVGNVRNTILQVKEMYWYRSIIIFIIALLNIVATVILLKITGNIVFAALSTGVSLFFGYILVHLILHIKNLIEVKRFFVEVWVKVIPVLLVISLGAFGINLISELGWLFLGLKVGMYAVLFAASIYWMYLNDSEKSHVGNFLLKFRS